MGLTAQFRPCIDLHDGKVKQIVGGTLENQGKALETNFVSSFSPDHYARLYRQDNLSGGHIIQLGHGNKEAALNALSAWQGHLQVGGGVTSENASFWLDAGASGVIVTSFVFENGTFREDRVKELVRKVGKDHLILDLSCRRTADNRYLVVTDRWQKFTELEVSGKVLDSLARYCREFLIHAVDVEGKQSGIDHDLLAILAKYSPVESVYAGGISSFEDIETIESAGEGRVHYTIGSALDIFGGKLSYRQVVDRQSNN